MENYAYTPYPDSGHSSPQSREIEFENPTPWEDQSQQQNQDHRAKFMCSYGGKIHPRPHDNQLSYIGGETKILAVDPNTKFSTMISKLAALCGDTDISFKYQLPGEDLDALISVTNDDDLDHMMHEYDRLYRVSAKPARMRLFLFPVNPSPAASFGSEGSKSERDRFVEALNSGMSHVTETNKSASNNIPNNVDFLFGGLERGVAPLPPPQLKVAEVHVGMSHEDQVIRSDPANIHTQFQRMQIREQEQEQRMQIREHEQEQRMQIREQRMQIREHEIREQEQRMQMREQEQHDNLVGSYPGEYYVQKFPDKVPPATLPVTLPPTVPAPAGYWPEKQIASGGFPPSAVTVTTTPPPPEQQVYVLPGPTPGTVYHTPVMRPVTGQTGQQYYMQRMGGPDLYREQPMYSMIPPPQQPPPQATQGAMGVVRPSGVGVGVTDAGYAPGAYDNAMGRQVYYTAQGGVMPPPQQYQGASGVAAVSGEMRHVGGGGAEPGR